jgi:hypothetical protein
MHLFLLPAYAVDVRKKVFTETKKEEKWPWSTFETFKVSTRANSFSTMWLSKWGNKSAIQSLKNIVYFDALCWSLILKTKGYPEFFNHRITEFIISVLLEHHTLPLRIEWKTISED